MPMYDLTTKQGLVKALSENGYPNADQIVKNMPTGLYAIIDNRSAYDMIVDSLCDLFNSLFGSSSDEKSNKTSDKQQEQAIKLFKEDKSCKKIVFKTSNKNVIDVKNKFRGWKTEVKKTSETTSEVTVSR